MSRTITALAEALQAKDAAYLERNRCVALLVRMALVLGLRAGLARTAIEGWSAEWHGCVYIDLPTGQVSWHYHDSQAHLFAGLPAYAAPWDGHDTPEKYRRVAKAFPVGTKQPWPHEATDRVHELLGQVAAKELECQRLRERATS